MLAFSIAVSLCKSATAISVPEAEGVSFQQVEFDYPGVASDPNSDYGEINLNYSALNTNGFSNGYVNVVRGSSWVVQNLPVSTTSGYPGMSTYFDLGVSDGTDVNNFSPVVDFSPTPLIAAPSGVGTLYNNAGGNFTADEIEDQEGDGAGRTTKPGAPAGPITFGGGANSVAYQPGHTNVEQDVNQCGPASVANSMDYLRTRYGINVPAAKTNTPGVGGNPASSIVGQLDQTMNRPQGQAISNMQFINGKLRYMKNNNITGISVESTGGDGVLSGGDYTDPVSGLTAKNGGALTSQWILDQLAKGQDVELNVRWTGGGGHWVDLIGGGMILGVPWVAYVNDANQGFDAATGKTAQQRRRWFVRRRLQRQLLDDGHGGQRDVPHVD